jgi:hypothetical protein
MSIIKFRKELKRVISRWQALKALQLANRTLVAYLFVMMNRYIRAQARLKEMDQEGLFLSTNLETFGACNRKCSFCFNLITLAAGTDDCNARSRRMKTVAEVIGVTRSTLIEHRLRRHLGTGSHLGTI